MGKGDIKTRRGKIFAGTYGVTRKRKTKKAVVIPVKKEKEEKSAEKKTTTKKTTAKKSTTKTTAKKTTKKATATKKTTTAKAKKEE